MDIDKLEQLQNTIKLAINKDNQAKILYKIYTFKIEPLYLFILFIIGYFIFNNQVGFVFEMDIPENREGWFFSIGDTVYYGLLYIINFCSYFFLVLIMLIVCNNKAERILKNIKNYQLNLVNGTISQEDQIIIKYIENPILFSTAKKEELKKYQIILNKKEEDIKKEILELRIKTF